MKIKLYQKNGFSILAVILVIVAVIVAIGIWSLSGQTNSSNSATSSTDIYASSIITDSLALKTVYDKYIINGYQDGDIAYEIGWKNSNGLANILDPTEGTTIRKSNQNAIRTNPSSLEGYWINVYYAETLLGTPSGMERMMVLNGVKNNVCKRINYSLHGSENIPDLGKTGEEALFAMNISFNSPYTTTSLVFPPSIPNWTSGCIGSSTIADKNIYFLILRVK